MLITKQAKILKLILCHKITITVFLFDESVSTLCHNIKECIRTNERGGGGEEENVNKTK